MVYLPEHLGISWGTAADIWNFMVHGAFRKDRGMVFHGKMAKDAGTASRTGARLSSIFVNGKMSAEVTKFGEFVTTLLHSAGN